MPKAPRTKPQYTCAECGIAFIPTHLTQKYHNNRCRMQVLQRLAVRSTPAQTARREGIIAALRANRDRTNGDIAAEFRISSAYVANLQKHAKIKGRTCLARSIRQKARAAKQQRSHYINLRLDKRTEPTNSIVFRLDSELYVRLLRWAALRQKKPNVTQAIKAMIVKTIGVSLDQRTLMERLDDWRLDEAGFETRTDAVRWIIANMLARSR